MFWLFGSRQETQPSAVAAGRSASPGVSAAIAEGARKTGVDFTYMLKTAQRESALNPTAKAPTSSARGLYQFIDQTWLAMVKQEGGKFGLSAEAAAISRGSDGRFGVADPAMRRQILALRDDPTLSATMAGAFTTRNAGDLKAAIGRDATAGELYMAHVLGASGAAKLVSAAANAPQTTAARLFPEAAGANRPLFYHRNGQPKSASELYAGLAAHHNGGSARAVAPSNIVTAVAAANAATTARAPSRSYVVETYVPDRYSPVPQMKSAQAGFGGMFAGNRTAPVSPMVQAMWSDTPARQQVNPASGPMNLDLFRDAPRAATRSA